MTDTTTIPARRTPEQLRARATEYDRVADRWERLLVTEDAASNRSGTMHDEGVCVNTIEHYRDLAARTRTEADRRELATS